jgi:hypothetical protein
VADVFVSGIAWIPVSDDGDVCAGTADVEREELSQAALPCGADALTTPDAGPDSSVSTGRSLAYSTEMTPPFDLVRSGAIRSPASRRVARGSAG